MQFKTLSKTKSEQNNDDLNTQHPDNNNNLQNNIVTESQGYKDTLPTDNVTALQSHKDTSLQNSLDTMTQDYIDDLLPKVVTDDNKKSQTVRISNEALDVLWQVASKYRCSLKYALDIIARYYALSIVTDSQGYKGTKH